MPNLHDFLKLSGLLRRFRAVERSVNIKDSERPENDAEHSFSLAIFAWYAIDAAKLPLDKSLVLEYALIHDLVEAYAGDTNAHLGDREGKALREKEAAERIAGEFPEFPDLYAKISAYEARADEESKFVYALDKFIAPLFIYEDGGKSWRRDGITLAMVRENKLKKSSVYPEVEKYFEELIKVLEEKESELFPN